MFTAIRLRQSLRDRLPSRRGNPQMHNLGLTCAADDISMCGCQARSHQVFQHFEWKATHHRSGYRATTARRH
jgi:hypothetical protein